MDFVSFALTQCLSALSQAAILFFVACGLTLIFGIMRVVNFAHGVIFMLGAYVGYSASKLTESFVAALIVAPIVVGLAKWASRSPGMRYDAPLGTDSLVLSLEALFDGPAAAGLEATIALHLGDERFQVCIADGQLTVTRGETDRPDAALDTDQATLLSLLRTDRPLDAAVASGELRLAGDRAVIERFRRLFPPPQPVPVADRT